MAIDGAAGGDKAAVGRAGGGGEVVCVTGASGFMASWLVKRLLQQGYRVRGTVRNSGDEAKTTHLWGLPGAQEHLELFSADLLTEGSFDAVVDGCQGVFHTATAVVGVESDPQVELIDPAVKGTLNVLQSCAKASSVKRVVLTSSSSTCRFPEDHKPDVPLDGSNWTSLEVCQKYQLWYVKAKTLAEKAAWEFSEENNLDLVAVLPSFIIGPVLPPDLSFTVSDVLGFLKGESKTLTNLGRVGFVHIDDVATAHILVYENSSAKGRFICSSSVFEIPELAKHLAIRYPELNIPSECEGYVKRPHYFFDSSKIEKLGLHFKTIEEMFDDCLASFKEKGFLA